MARILITIIAATAILIAGAKLNPESRLRLYDAPTVQSRADSISYTPLILKVGADSTMQQLTDMGVIIYHYRDDLLLTSIPDNMVDSVLGYDDVLYAATCGILNECLDIARPFADVDAVQLGDYGLPHPYDGSGVVTGFSDVGFDSKHIAFAGRVGAVYDYNTVEGIVRKAETSDELERWTTDTPDNWHATHVANIMAGGYKGNGYYGAATGSEIVATTSLLHDVGILSGVEDIITYAKSKDKPAVINLSLSSFLGPHDGTDLMCQYLSRCAKDAVICISAGNTGHINGFATQDLKEGTARTLVSSLKGTRGFEVRGYTDIWSDSHDTFEFAVEVYDCDTEMIVYRGPWIGAEEYLILSDETDPEWAEYMTGRIVAYGEVSELNGRYNLTVMYDTKTEEAAQSNNTSRFYTCLAVRQPDGYMGNIHVDMFADASLSFFKAPAGTLTEINANGSINNMCTADGVIAVGMACSRNVVPLIDGELQTWPLPVDHIAVYSSYSDTPYIEPLPHISGPGYYVISAMSTPYVEAHPEIVSELSAECSVNERENYWYAASGTSMSAPMVAGIIATWLQADPTLTSERVKNIVQSTAKTDFPDISDPRWGAGCIDAISGLKKVLDESGKIDTTIPSHISVGPDRRLYATGIALEEVLIYDIRGIAVHPTSQLSPGVYIISLPNDGSKIKIVVK